MNPGAPGDGPVLRAWNLHRWLGRDEGRVHVLRGVSLELAPGRHYAVAGPSGCGKSSLLYLLGLLDHPNEGGIWLRGADMTDAPEEERTRARNAHIGFVFQFHFLLTEFSALENIILPMRKLGKLTPEEMEETARKLLADVGLADKAERRANHLSGGEQQRLALARALANSPSILLADEPTGNLDIQNSRQIFDLLRRFAREKNQAVLMVTHNLELARQCDRLYEMRDGQFF